ncbi:hypothetical protein QTP88_000601 [Uroleucon formosanum]
MPIIKVSDKEKLRLLKVIDSHRTLSCAFRTWDLCEYPILPRNTSHSWTVKSSSLLEKPRFVLFGLQTDRKKNNEVDAGRFDHCQLKNLKVHLNSEVYPYEDFRADFKNNTTSILYKAYTDFQKSYYERDYSEPLLSKHIFQNYVPIVVVDLSRQNDNVKSSTVDLRIEFETDTVIPEKTAAYCLILHDQIITYNPFSGDLVKFSVEFMVKETSKLRNLVMKKNTKNASRLIVKTAIANMSDKAKSTREKSSQIIQDIHSAVPITARPYMPSVEATRKIILKARRKLLPPEPSSVEEINIPDNLKK